jgi:hypothetical protein
MTKLMQEAATISTPAIQHLVPEPDNMSLHIKELVYEKRRARRRWKNSQNSLEKTYLNRLPHNLQTSDGQKIKYSIIISQSFLQTTIQYDQKKIRGLQSASELYRLSNRHFLAKFSANFCG